MFSTGLVSLPQWLRFSHCARRFARGGLDLVDIALGHIEMPVEITDTIIELPISAKRIPTSFV